MRVCVVMCVCPSHNEVTGCTQLSSAQHVPSFQDLFHRMCAVISVLYSPAGMFCKPNYQCTRILKCAPRFGHRFLVQVDCTFQRINFDSMAEVVVEHRSAPGVRNLMCMLRRKGASLIGRMEGREEVCVCVRVCACSWLDPSHVEVTICTELTKLRCSTFAPMDV